MWNDPSRTLPSACNTAASETSVGGAALVAKANRDAAPAKFNRRTLLTGAGLGLIGAWAYPWLRRALAAPQPVFIARNQRYDGPLERTIRDGLLATGLKPAEMVGRRVLLKPNLVEPNRGIPQMTTNPAVVTAAAAVFQAWGASVRIGEAPGHVRDTEMALVESGLQAALDDARLLFADLNYEEVGWLKNAGGISALKGFYFPQSILEADLIVSMPKMKTHHWMGMTGAMKNLYGTLPGSQYGWPKNALHHAGIPQTVYDINASLPKTIAIVDGIVGMEGDGPILGSPKPMGLLLVGANPTAIDATLARIMGLVPDRIPYLSLAAGELGPIDERLIPQRGEAWRPLVSPFKILDQPHLQSLRASPGELLSALPVPQMPNGIRAAAAISV
jgi:uncharacterized protein (DUF362 family)